MASAWLFQKPEQIEAMGEKKAPWYVGWYDPDNRRRKKSFGAGVKAKALAERHKMKLEEELTAGTYQSGKRKDWAEFIEEYKRRVLDGLAVRTREASTLSLSHFLRVAKPKSVPTVTAQHIAEFVARRRSEPGKKKGDLVSPASIN
jgi:hypothetical protein